jgi:glycosyltransferase involved in cell wall biosynthesis
LSLFRELGIEHNTVHLQVDDEGLSNLYSHAQAFIFSSKYEGFGLPVLEAMACGTPCVLSNVTSLPEVGGDGALYFNPESADELSQVIARVLNDSTLAEEMRRNGFERATQFTWEKTARLHEEMYRSL